MAYFDPHAGKEIYRGMSERARRFVDDNTGGWGDAAGLDFMNQDSVSRAVGLSERVGKNLGAFDEAEIEQFKKYFSSMNVGINNDDYEIDAQKRSATKEKQKLEDKRKARLDRLMKAEAGLNEGLLGAQRATEDAISEQLTQLLRETGIAANVARQAVGTQYADAGLSRSTFAQQGIEDVTSSEVDKKGAQRLAASEQVSKVRRVTDQSLYDIKTRRERAREAADLDQEQAFQDQVQALEKEQINRFYNTAIENIGLNAQDAAYMANLTGGVFAGAGELFGRYMRGSDSDPGGGGGGSRSYMTSGGKD